MIIDDAEYTVKLRTLLEDPIAKITIDHALSEYPMYEKDPQPSYISTRQQLNQKLLDHYKYREIGFETPGRFIDELRIAMNEIMPYYVQLYKSHDLMESIDDPFGNVDIVETFEQQTLGTSKGNSKGTANSETNTTNSAETNDTSKTSAEAENNGKNVKSSTPQSLLSIPAEEIDTVSYADEANWNEDNSKSSGETTNEGKSSSEGKSASEGTTTSESNNETQEQLRHTLTKKGNQGVNTYAHDMKELRETFLNIDKMIIENQRIAELFMQIY